MENKIELKPVSELLGMNFFIPSYQRGYRWTKQQVEDLLDDLYSFSKKLNKSEKEFYCLQPIIVRSLNSKEISQNVLESKLDDNKWYEVIDGQQRLTTIRILISYLIKKHLNGESLESEYNKFEFLIDYETRDTTKEFIDNISNYETSETENLENIDFYHIYESYKTIFNWFNSQVKPRDVRESIFRMLINDMKTKKQEGIAQVIWYENNDGSNQIGTFIRINMGKIPLTNSELIKALFLQKKNFDDSKAELRQIEIANEWDRIEYSLQNDNFWWFLNKKENDIPVRIEFLFDLMCEVAKKDDGLLEKQIGTDKYATFRFFSEKFKNEEVLKNWNDVKDYFLAFDEWFNEPVWYHYIGYLITFEISIIDIYQDYKGSSKDVFLDKLKIRIRKMLEAVNCKKVYINNVFSYTINLPFEAKNKSKIREILLLFNVEYIVKQYVETKKTENSELFLRFPFEIYKRGSWDIEHINSFTENSLVDGKSQNEWLEQQLIDFASELTDEIKEKIGEFINNKNVELTFQTIQKEVCDLIKTNTVSEKDKDNFGNLTLLDFNTNRGYGNALFPAKRRVIIEKDTKGKFIPICTKNIFLKYFDKKGTSKSEWGETDMFNYQNHLGEVLSDFLTFKESSNE